MSNKIPDTDDLRVAVVAAALEIAREGLPRPYNDNRALDKDEARKRFDLFLELYEEAHAGIKETFTKHGLG